MYTLALDTTGYKIHLVLLKNDAIIFERDWRSNMNEDETIMKTIQHLNDIEPFFAQKLTRMIVSEGPGTLTGTRVGVTIANALAYATKASIVKLSSHDIWPMRLRDEDKELKPHFLLRITEQELYVDGEVMQLKDAVKFITKYIGKGKKRNGYIAYGELTPTQFTELNRIKGFTWIIETDLLSFGRVTLGIHDKGTVKPAVPRYAKPPVITESKKEQLVVKIKLDGLPDFVAPKVAQAPKAPVVKTVEKPAEKLVQKVAPKAEKKIVKAIAKKLEKKPTKKIAKKVVVKKPAKKPVKKLLKKVTPKKVIKVAPKKAQKKAIKKSFSPLRALAKKFKSFKNKKR
ncbi:hypothetical protein KAZ92_02250 [Candidatus Gracilibacteria bacterium]|nr:hypothetical protein [Candidatus Gracilibacteria bacterium]